MPGKATHLFAKLHYFEHFSVACGHKLMEEKLN